MLGPSPKHPEWVQCIADPHQEMIGKALCGRAIGSARVVNGEKELVPSEWVFVSIDHWFCNSRNKGRLLGCPECVARVTEQCTRNADEIRGGAELAESPIT